MGIDTKMLKNRLHMICSCIGDGDVESVERYLDIILDEFLTRFDQSSIGFVDAVGDFMEQLDLHSQELQKDWEFNPSFYILDENQEVFIMCCTILQNNTYQYESKSESVIETLLLKDAHKRGSNGEIF